MKAHNEYTRGLTANRQRELKRRRAANGLVRVAVWVPAEHRAELQNIARQMRETAELPRTGGEQATSVQMAYPADDADTLVTFHLGGLPGLP